MFEVCADAEDRNVWALLLRLEHFEASLQVTQQSMENMEKQGGVYVANGAFKDPNIQSAILI